MDYDKHCKISFWKYVKNEPKKTNTQPPRKIDAIYLTVNFKNQGGYVVLDLKYGLTITRIKFTDIPVKKMVIKSVGNMAAENKITTLKLENKSGVLLYPNYWMAGVHYEDKNTNEIKDIHNDEQSSWKDDIEQDERMYAEEHCKWDKIISKHAKNINENEPDDINENELDENTVAYLSDIIVSTKGSDFR